MKLFNIIIAIAFFSFCSCKKLSFLDAKPDMKLVTLNSLQDLQSLLDNDLVMNGSSGASRASLGLVPVLGEVGAGDWYLTQDVLDIIPSMYKNAYLWNDDIYDGTGNLASDWLFPYRAIFYANVALDGLKGVEVSSENINEYNNIKGSALFYRAYVFFHLAQVFSPTFDPQTADSDLGIPLRITSDSNEKIQRASLKKTYEKIIADLLESESYLPIVPAFKTRPSKPAVYALMAKTYLLMQQYDLAIKYANSCLSLHDKLLDYNEIDSTIRYPFSRFNDEVLFHSVLVTVNSFFRAGLPLIDSLLIDSYHINDLRKKLFFEKSPSGGSFFQGSYDGNKGAMFSGIATDEIYLIRAECYARKADMSSALKDLNHLLAKRWRKGTFVDITMENPSDLLTLIFSERRKELLMRGLRWSDLKRLNNEGANIVLTRNDKGTKYTLLPNSPAYNYLIPPAIIGFNPDMPQNRR